MSFKDEGLGCDEIIQKYFRVSTGDCLPCPKATVKKSINYIQELSCNNLQTGPRDQELVDKLSGEGININTGILNMSMFVLSFFLSLSLSLTHSLVFSLSLSLSVSMHWS